jgi:ABC-type phosphate/phosphonate transport system substrate-binding protein
LNSYSNIYAWLEEAMHKTSMLLICAASLAAVETSQASPLDSPETVYIDGKPCNGLCQYWMGYRQTASPHRHSFAAAKASIQHQSPRTLTRGAAQVREAGSKPIANGGLAKQPARTLIETAHAKVTDLEPGARGTEASDTVVPTGTADHSGARTPLEQVTAATAVAERLTAATSVVILLARPEVRSISDLAGKSIAIDNGQSASSASVRTAIVNAGAAEAQLTENQIKALDRVIRGEVSAAVLTLASPEAAEGFPEIAGFNIFRIPLAPQISQVKSPDLQPAASAATETDAARTRTADLHSSNTIVTSSSLATTRKLVEAALAVTERMTASTGDSRDSGHIASSADHSDRSENDADTRTAILMARPEIKSMSDLAGQNIAIDGEQSPSSDNLEAAIAKAGAAKVQLTENQSRPLDRVIDGEVPAAVLTLASREAAGGFPDIAGFRVFRIPLSP